MTDSSDGRPLEPGKPAVYDAAVYDARAVACDRQARDARTAGRPGRALLHEQHAAEWRALARARRQSARNQREG